MEIIIVLWISSLALCGLAASFLARRWRWRLLIIPLPLAAVGILIGITVILPTSIAEREALRNSPLLGTWSCHIVGDKFETWRFEKNGEIFKVVNSSYVVRVGTFQPVLSDPDKVALQFDGAAAGSLYKVIKNHDSWRLIPLGPEGSAIEITR